MIEFLEKIGIQNAVLYIIGVNLIGFFTMGLDKWKAKNKMWRVPENTFFMLTAIGGGIGTVAGMFLFRHKTQKPQFRFGLPAILILEIIFVIVLMVR